MLARRLPINTKTKLDLYVQQGYYNFPGEG